jgi:AcrR family transcriptional regulator
MEQITNQRRKMPTQKQRKVGGRPPTMLAGEVDTRILKAATNLFLLRGFDATSCDQVAVDAGAGKASIYARYANKDALFKAVVNQNLSRIFSEHDAISLDKPLRERLIAVVISISEDVLKSDFISLLRVIISEAPRFSNLAKNAQILIWNTSAKRITEVITVHSAHDAHANARAMPVATLIIDVFLAPHLMRALLGEDRALPKTSFLQHVEDTIEMVFATRRLDEWI